MNLIIGNEGNNLVSCCCEFFERVNKFLIKRYSAVLIYGIKIALSGNPGIGVREASDGGEYNSNRFVCSLERTLMMELTTGPITAASAVMDDNIREMTEMSIFIPSPPLRGWYHNF